MGFVIGNVADTYPFEVLVGLGYLPNVLQEYKFGYNTDLAAGVEEDVWDFGGTYTFSTTADIDSISSSSAADTQMVLVAGLDSNYDLLTVPATLDGQNKVTLGTSFLRVWRVVNLGSTDFAGSVYVYVDGAITAGIPDVATTIRAYVDNGNNQTLMMIYTVPRGYTGIIRRVFLNLGGRKNGFCTVKYWAKPFGMVFQIKGTTDLATTGTSAVQSLFKTALVFPEKTDFKVSATGDVNGLTLGGSAGINLYKDI